MSVRQAQARVHEIIRQLSELSREGWKYATRADYEPLEAELGALLRTLSGRCVYIGQGIKDISDGGGL